MTEIELQARLSAREKDLNPDDVPTITQYLATRPDSVVLSGLERIKSTSTALLLCLFLSGLGIDMFYIKNNKRGGLKLAISILTVISFLLGFVFMWGTIMTGIFNGGGSGDPVFNGLMIGGYALGIVLAVVGVILWIVDLFRIRKMTKDVNTKMLLEL